MSDPAKSNNPFSFGQPATSGGSGNLFGQTNTTASTSTGGLFGSSANPPVSSAASPFGNTSTAGGGSLFGAGGVSSNLFGGGANKPAGGSGWSFGQVQGNNTSGGNLGTGQTGQQNDAPASSAAPSSGFTGFSTPTKPPETTTGPSQTPAVSGGASSTGPFAFGNLGSNTSSAGQTNTTTPNSKPTTSLFGNSTTPAGPPPSTSAGGTTMLFGSNPPQDASNAFASFGGQSSAPGNNSTTAAPSGFSGFDFGASKSKEAPVKTSTVQSPSIFGSTPSTQASNLFGNKRSAQPDSGNLFGMNKSQDTGATKPTTSQQSQSEIPKASTLFSDLGGNSSATAPATQTTSASQPAFGFLKANQPQSSATNPVSSPTTAPSAFGFFSSPPKSSGTSATSTNAPFSNLFSNTGKTQDKAPTTTSEAASTPAASTSAPAPASSLFGNFAKSTAPNDVSQAPTQPATTAKAEGTGATNVNLGASTAGPPPPAQSRLKNKSMDDIITRWASDLSKYQKEFQKQADKVATWDRMLVENSEKIQKLYGSTLEAERATTEVERQLAAVESDQETLELWLDHYEKEVDSMIASQQSGPGETISAPDQERERTYQIASKLSERLDEMGKDLTTMIEEINDASSTLSKTGKADDPLTQVVRVLNSHLTQLQQIDQGAAALQLKVQEAQRTGQTLTSLSGPTSDAADGFYRSYMGRR
ncbi:FG-nucleoporin nsp1 [Imshaugia aleurites]|uniref:Nucleoporin NSP1 n=1 Tax=Imshaugia aleurites TaxID=172621 RepID=A0A8H3FUN3_9LECA|nr:FG-nucleoporin nsp1 [Imshaugia aleurites]